MTSQDSCQFEDSSKSSSALQRNYSDKSQQTEELVSLLERDLDAFEAIRQQRKTEKREKRLEIMRAFGEVIGINEFRNPKFYKAVVAEFIGTAILVLVGCGSVATLNPKGSAETLAVAFSFGFALAISVWVFGHISGSHVNPSVSIGFLVTGTISIIRCLLFICAQCAGALLAAGIAWGCIPQTLRGNIGVTTLHPDVEIWQGVIIEGVATFLLVLTVFACCDRLRTDHSGSIALTIGLCVTAQITWMGTLTGGSMNPARSLGPAIVTGIWENHWIYWTAPITGGIIAALVYEHVYAERTRESDVELHAHRYNNCDTTRQGFLDYTIEIEPPKEETADVPPEYSKGNFDLLDDFIRNTPKTSKRINILRKLLRTNSRSEFPSAPSSPTTSTNFDFSRAATANEGLDSPKTPKRISMLKKVMRTNSRSEFPSAPASPTTSISEEDKNQNTNKLGAAAAAATTDENQSSVSRL